MCGGADLSQSHVIESASQALVCSHCALSDHRAQMLHCDVCGTTTHCFCCRPPRAMVARGTTWLCSDCSVSFMVRARRDASRTVLIASVRRSGASGA